MQQQTACSTVCSGHDKQKPGLRPAIHVAFWQLSVHTRRQKAAQLQAPQTLTSSAQVHITGTFQGKRNPSEGREYRSTGIKAREKPFTYQEKFYPSCIINSQHISVPKNQFTLEKKKKVSVMLLCEHKQQSETFLWLFQDWLCQIQVIF